MVTPCINNIQHFNNQLMHPTLKNLELLKHFKISCFGILFEWTQIEYQNKHYDTEQKDEGT